VAKAHVVMYYVSALATLTQRHDLDQRPNTTDPGGGVNNWRRPDLIRGSVAQQPG
jgi:hypothetical protein